HQVYSAKSDIEDGAGRELVTAYALKRPDGEWSLLIVNRDQQNSHRVRIEFRGAADSAASFAGPIEIATFGSAQYKWNPPRMRFMAHAEMAAAPTVVAYTNGTADPDGPILRSQQNAAKETLYDLPAASVVVIRGNVATHSF
ncbi:MAG: glycosyl hydrolase family 5, partial [Terriglobales bacterium]